MHLKTEPLQKLAISVKVFMFFNVKDNESGHFCI